MLESFDDLVIDKDLDSAEKLIESIVSQVGINLNECTAALCDVLKSRADELLHDIENVAPFGNYEKLLDKPEEILSFLKEEASKPENWKVSFIDKVKDNNQLIEFVFVNSSVDDGDILKGYAFIGTSGKIRHVFCQIHT